HADAAVARGDRADRADQRKQRDTVGHRGRSSHGMRGPARDARQRKYVEDKGGGERVKVLGRVRKCILPTVVGKSIAWPLRRDDPQSSLARGLIGESEHISRARRTMDGEHWQALHIAKLGVTDAPSV